MVTYYLYHISSKEKIGVTTDITRRMRHHGRPKYEILETHTDPKTVGDREQELQRQYGYEVDKIHYLTLTQRDYSKSTNNGIKGDAWEDVRFKFDTETSKIAGSKGGTTTQSQIHICPHCNKEGKGTAMKRWHFDNCKHKKTLTN
tara:strand:- start:56 stop:490 length:435 start_codon:yes stop_codon:yes gene_type:complete